MEKKAAMPPAATAALEATPRAATLADALGREPSLDEVAAPIQESLETAIGGRAERLCTDVELERDVESLVGLYAGDSWTWRR